MASVLQRRSDPGFVKLEGKMAKTIWQGAIPGAAADAGIASGGKAFHRGAADAAEGRSTPPPQTSVANDGLARLRTRAKKALTIQLKLPAELPLTRLTPSSVPGFFNAAVMPPLRSDEIQVVCRHAYYTLDARGFQVGEPQLEQVRNSTLRFRRVATGFELADVAALPALDRLEDIRFYEFDGCCCFFAVGFVAPKGEARPVPVVGRLRREEGLSAETRVVTQAVGPVEKNWVYFRGRNGLYLEKYPGMSEVYRVHPQSLGLTYSRTGSATFSWSGTKSVPVDDGNLFLDHRRVYLIRGGRTVQRYVYRFRHVPFEGITRHSKPFRVGGETALVYVSDMALSADPSRLLLAASRDDNSFDLFDLELAQALAMTARR